MTDTTPRAGAPLLAAAQAQKHVTHNEALYQFDALIGARFLDRDLSAPPPSPSDGDAYLVKATGTGAWAGQDGKIAYCADGGWRFYAPFAGLVAYVSDEAANIVYDGASWAACGSGGGGSTTATPMLGINATADSTNKLSVTSNAALFAGESVAGGGTGDMRITLSKDAAGNTASLLYQDAFSGRAEIGLAGDDDFHFKVSPDGSSWTDAIVIDSATGAAAIRGTATNDDAGAGIVGEYGEAVVPSAARVSLTTGTAKTIAYVDIPAGDHDVTAWIGFFGATTTSVKSFIGSISLADNTLDSDPGHRAAMWIGNQTVFSDGSEFDFSVATLRMNFSATTRVYLVAIGNFSVSTCQAFGRIGWRRRR
ncbi:MAG: DUF2793 domain-containing protein [Rhizomicrobium sp.]